MHRPITTKQIKLLKVLAINPYGERMIATWQAQDLIDLARHQLVGRECVVNTAGKLSTLAIWFITKAGRDFLTTERAGQ